MKVHPWSSVVERGLRVITWSSQSLTVLLRQVLPREKPSAKSLHGRTNRSVSRSAQRMMGFTPNRWHCRKPST